jgi:hypothetical protein
MGIFSALAHASAPRIFVFALQKYGFYFNLTKKTGTFFYGENWQNIAI